MKLIRMQRNYFFSETYKLRMIKFSQSYILKNFDKDSYNYYSDILNSNPINRVLSIEILSSS